MMSKRSGVAAEIIKLEPKFLAAHRHCHSLNFTVKSKTEQCQLSRDTLDTVREICILVKYSPKREKILRSIFRTTLKVNIKTLPLMSCAQQDELSVQFARATLSTIEAMRNEESFRTFY